MKLTEVTDEPGGSEPDLSVLRMDREEAAKKLGSVALLGGVALAVLTGVVGGLAPAWSAARKPIPEAMQAV